MKETLPFGGLIILLSLAVLPGYSFGEVRISLRNEASIIADECREEAGRLVCYKMGGSFEIDKRDVLSIKNISARQAPVSAAGSSDVPTPGKSDSSVVAGEKADGALPAGKTPDAASPSNPSDSFAQKRMSLQNERESLLRERQEIQDAVKDSPDWMSEQQFNALTRRNAELDARIKKFNEEANRLSEQRKQQGLGIKKQ